MDLCELFQQKKCVLSFEVFPPKKSSGVESIYRTLDELCALRPDFISVTFGAGGLPRHKAPRRGVARPQARGNYPWLPSPHGSHRPGF